MPDSCGAARSRVLPLLATADVRAGSAAKAKGRPEAAVASDMFVAALPTGLAVAAAVPFALLTKPILVQARAAQFRTYLPSRRSLPTCLAIAAAIAFASFAELILVLASAT